MEPKLELKLPIHIITSRDLGRLQQELEAIDGFLIQAAVRKTGSKVTETPRTTPELEELAKNNQLNLLSQTDRTKLKKFFEQIRRRAPTIHISFAAEPSSQFLQKITEWFRKEIHPFTLLQIGLQPSIAAGCIVRTQNRYFDFSLRQDFYKQRQLLINKLANREINER